MRRSEVGESFDEPEEKSSCLSQGFGDFARGMSIGLIVSAIIIDVHGYAAALKSFHAGKFPPPELLFPFISNAVRRSWGVGTFFGIFTAGDCSFKEHADQHGIPSPIYGAFCGGLAAGTAGFLQQKYSPNRLAAGSAVVAAAVYGYRYLETNTDLEVRVRIREE